jgi:hypothetical protein
MMPECMLQNIAQPQTNPAAGENASRRNTYTPPVLGNADTSSAQTSAPHRVSRPEAIHAANTPPTEWIAPVTAEGCTKIEAPMIVPTTMAVARPRPKERSRS